MKRCYVFALILASALLITLTYGAPQVLAAKDDSTTSDRASAAAAAARGEDDGPEVDPQKPVNNVIPYAVPTDFDGARTQIQRCANLTDNILRIRCYDRLATDMGVTITREAKQKEEELAKYGFWRITSRSNQVGEVLTNARLPANKPYQSNSGVERNAELVISCKIQSTDLYIDWKGMIGRGSTEYNNKIQLVYSADNQQGVLTNWDVSFDRFAAFAPHALDFIRTLHGVKNLVFQGKPEPDNTVTLVFTLDGLENVLKILYDRCYKDQAAQ